MAILKILDGLTGRRKSKTVVSKLEVLRISQAIDRMSDAPRVHEMTNSIKKESPLLVGNSLLSNVKAKIMVLPVWWPPSRISDFRLHR
jgi:hypothetical protein